MVQLELFNSDIVNSRGVDFIIYCDTCIDTKSAAAIAKLRFPNLKCVAEDSPKNTHVLRDNGMLLEIYRPHERVSVAKLVWRSLFPDRVIPRAVYAIALWFEKQEYSVNAFEVLVALYNTPIEHAGELSPVWRDILTESGRYTKTLNAKKSEARKHIVDLAFEGFVGGSLLVEGLQ